MMDDRVIMQLLKTPEGEYTELSTRTRYTPVNVLKINRFRTQRVAPMMSPVFVHADHVSYVIRKSRGAILGVIGVDVMNDLYFMQIMRAD